MNAKRTQPHPSFFTSEKLTVIAGPCMLESEEVATAVLEFMKKECSDLGLRYVFKASFDKANRTSGNSVRGPGLVTGLKTLAALKEKHKVSLLTDVHTPDQCAPCSEVIDILQIPAFLCEDRALLRAASSTGRSLQIKKAQTLAPERLQAIADFCLNSGAAEVALCERGTTFGYHNLIVDFRNIDRMRETGSAVVFDATHSVQLPGAGAGVSSGMREHIATLSRAAAAAGVDGLFMEVHPSPREALSDKDTQLTLSEAKRVLQDFAALDRCRRQLSPSPLLLQKETP